MGNSQIKELYKDNKPHEDEFPLSINAESLQLGDEYVRSFLKTVQQALNISDTSTTQDSNRDKMFPMNNVQKNKNDVDRDFMRGRVMQFLSDNYICGFSNSLSNIQGLSDQLYCRYFTVETDSSTKNYTLARLDSYRFLYSLFMSKQDKKATEQTFFEYIDKFLQEEGDSYNSQIALYTGMVLDLVSEDRLLNTLKFFLQKLEDTCVKSGEENYCESNAQIFVVDSNLNQSRELLVAIIKDKKSSLELVTLAFKIIFRFGITRRNAEDFLLMARLIDQDPTLAAKVDLRAEFKAMPAIQGGQTAASATEQESETKKNTISWQSLMGANIQYLWLLSVGDKRQDWDYIRSGKSWTADSDYFYYINSSGYLMKISKIESGTNEMPMLVDINEETDLNSDETIVYLKGKLYIYNASNEEKPLSIFKADSLKRDTEAEEAIKWDEEEGAITMKCRLEFDKETGRRLWYSPMFTDGESLFLISTRKWIKPKDADEDTEALPLATVVEQFDPTDNFKHVNSVTLVKNEQGDHWINRNHRGCDEYEVDFIFKSYVATNGKNLLWRTKYGQIKVFDMKTGIKLRHTKDSDEEPVDYNLQQCDEHGVFYVPETGNWFMVDKDERHQYNYDTCYQITDFKWDALSKVVNADSNQKSSTCENMSDHFKKLYLENYEKPPNNNVIRRIMTGRKQPKDTGKAQAPLPADSANIMKATLLGFVASNCQKFNVSYQEAMQNNTPQDNFIHLFRFPYATYVTSEMFTSLSYFMSRCQTLRKEAKTKETLAMQHSFLYTLQILAANFKALSFCGIKLPEILDEEANYKEFLDMYQKCIMQMIEQGYTDASDECTSLWKSIYQQCQSIIVNSMELLYSDTKEVIFSLEKVFKQEEPQTSKQLENSAFSLQYLARRDNMKKLLKSEAEQQKSLSFVLETLSAKLVQSSVEKIQATKLTEGDLSADQPLSLFWRSYHEFQASLAENLLVEFEACNQKIKSNKGNSTELKAQKVADETSLERLSELICSTFKQLATQFKLSLTATQETLLADVRSKENEYFNDEVAQKFKQYQKRVKSLILDQRNSSSLLIYIETIPTICTQFVTICQSAVQDMIEIVQTISDYRSMLKSQMRPLSGKQGEAEDSDEETPKMDDVFVTNLDKLQRKVSWGIGLVSFSYSYIKSDTLTVEQLKEETPTQKMERLIMDSKILSGGIEKRKLHLFSSEIRDQLRNVLEVSGDYTLHEMIEIPCDDQAGDAEDERLNAIIKPGTCDHVDNLCKLLQFRLERARPMVTYARLGGPDALKVSRATFAVMVKYNEAQGSLDSLVDECDLMAPDLKDLEGAALCTKIQETLIESEMQDELKVIDTLWVNANKMRLWIMEKKKNLVNKIEKEQKQKFMEGLKKKRDQEKKEKEAKEEKENADKPKDSDEQQIDTSTKKDEKKSDDKKADEAKKDEDKKEDDEKKEGEEGENKDEEAEEEIKLTPEQEEELSKLVDADYEEQIQIIYGKIIAKSEMLLQMKVPQDYINPKKKDTRELDFIRKPTYVSDEYALNTQEKEQKQPAGDDKPQDMSQKSNWRDELLTWQQHQTDNQQQDEASHKILNDANASILSMLQLPITVKKIQKQIETKFLSAAKRVAGLKMLASIVSLDLAQGCANDLSNWFCTGLRHKTNELAHYLDQLLGCGNHLESQLRFHFFEIYKALLEKLKQATEKQEALSLLDAISWKFGSRDHQMISTLEVFKVLRFGNGHRKNILKRAWGRPLYCKVRHYSDAKEDLTAEILSCFEHIFFSVMSRIVDSQGGTAMDLKKGGTSTPGLQRHKSMINRDESEASLGMGVDILFRELNRSQQMVADFEGIDHFTYIWQKNKELKEECSKMEYPDELLFDEDAEEKEYLKIKEERKKAKEEAEKKKQEEEEKAKEGEEKKEDNTEEKAKEGEEKAVDTAEVEVTLTDDTKEEKQVEEEKVEAKDSEAKDSEAKDTEATKDDDKSDKEEDDEDAQKADAATKEAEELTEAQEKAREHLNNLTEAEFKTINKLYAESYIRRILRMIELFTSAAVHRDYPRQMVKRVANPFMLQTLMKVLLHSAPRSQQICITILQNLMEMGIPAQIFESTIEIVSQGERGKHILDTGNQSAIRFEKSQFLKFLFGFALQTRKAMWNSRAMQSEGGYEISQSIFRTLRRITLLEESYSEWSQELLSVQEAALMNFDALSSPERDVIFSMQIGGDFQRMATGTHAMTSSSQVVTILGYAQYELNRGIEDKELNQHHLKPVFNTEKDRLFGLFYDATCEERQEIINLPPHDCTPLEEPNTGKAKSMAEKSILITKIPILKKLVEVLTKPSAQKQASTDEIVVKVHILKCLNNLLKLVPSLMDTLSKEGLISQITDFLLETSAKKLPVNAVMPTAWLEAKASNIRAQCSFSTSTLGVNTNLRASIVEKKQLLFCQNQPDGNEIDFNVHLLSGINLYRIGSTTKPTFSVHLDHTNLPILSKKPLVSNGLVLMDSDSLLKLDDHALQVMQSSQVILTHDVKVQDLFKNMVKKATGADLPEGEEEQSDEKKEQWKWCLSCMILVVSKKDFEFVKQPKSVKVPDFYSDANLSPVQRYLKELEVIGGVSMNKVMPFLVELEDQSLAAVQSNIGEILGKISEEEKEYEEKIKQLDLEENQDEIAKVKAKREALIKEREQKVADKQSKLFEGSKQQSFIEKAIDESKYDELKNVEAAEIECDIFDLIKSAPDLTAEEKILRPIIDKIQKLDQNTSTDSDQAKSDEAMSKQYMRDITNFTSATLNEDYTLVLDQLLVNYAKQALKDVLHKGSLESLIPALLQSSTKQKRLACYLKSSYNQATLTRKATGQKGEVLALREMMRRVFKYCTENGNADAKNFMRRFVHEDVLQAAKKSAESIWTAKNEAVSKRFCTDEIAIQECNPYMLKFVTSLLLENRSSILTESKTYLPNLFSTIIAHMVKFWDNGEMKIVKVLLTSAMQIIFFSREYIEKFCQNDVVSKLVNNSLLTLIIKDINFMSTSSFSEQQKQMLEVYLGLISLKEEAAAKFNYKFDAILEITPGISYVKRGLKVVQDTENMEFLKYYIHKESLKPHQLKLLNETNNTQHPAFEVKTRSKFTYDQVERMKVTFNAQCAFAPMTFMGISSKVTGEDLELYTKEEVKSSPDFNFNRAHFYLFYPVKRQMAVAMGEHKFQRTGLSKESDQPQLVMDTKDLEPKKIFSHKFSSLMIDKDDQLWTTGQRYGTDHGEFTKLKIDKDEKIKDVFIGHKTRFVLTQSDKIYFQGQSKQFNLPNDQNCSSFKEFKLPDETEKIVHISCGNHYTVYTTASGKVWATGRQFLKRIGLDSDVPVVLPLPAGIGKVVKSYTSSTKEQQICIIQVDDGTDVPKFYSAGKAENGLLGQGGKTREAKTFKPVLVPEGVKISQLSIYADHALALSADDKLYAWGSNLQHRAGLQAEFTEGIFQPTHVPFVDGIKPIEVSTGLDHSLVLGKDMNAVGNKTKLYSMGKEEANYKHLGCSKEQASETVIHELTAFQDFTVLSFCAATKYNQLILAGEKKADDGLYEHQVGEKVLKGLMHAYQKDGKWVFIGEEELEARKAELPDVSIAFKCPIKDAEKVLSNTKFLPALDSLKLQAPGTDKAFPQSSLTSKAIEGPCYSALTKISSDELSVNLALGELLDCTNFDLHPLIYFRLTRPLADDARLPCLDLKNFYRTGSAYGVQFEVEPDLSWQINDRLIESTKAEYTEFIEALKKFPLKCDKELIKAMNKQMADIDKDHDKVEPDKDFKVAEMKFDKESKLRKVSDNIKKQRVKLIWQFNQVFVNVYRYLVAEPCKPFRGQQSVNTSASSLFNNVKHIILTAVKMKFVDKSINSLPTRQNGKESVTFKRHVAHNFTDSGQVDHTGEYTIFGQVYQQLKSKTPKWDAFKYNQIDECVFRCEFVGESSIDIGGPYREILTNISNEIEFIGTLPMMIKSVNQRTDHGDNRECYVVNSDSITPTHQGMFECMGAFLGNAFRTKSCLALNFAPVVWKLLNDQPLKEMDLKSFDTYAWQELQDMRKNKKEYSAAEFDMITEDTFTTKLSSGKEVELCEDGKQKRVDSKNLEEYISLVLKARFEESNQQIKWIQEGMWKIVPRSTFNMLDWEEIEIRAVGEKTVDPEKLKKITVYENCSESTPIIKLFWQVFEELSEEDKGLYLKYVWGRQRLPSDLKNLRYQHTLYFCGGDPESLPKAHTCFFQIDLPNYPTAEILEKKLLTAIRFCGDIDDD